MRKKAEKPKPETPKKASQPTPAEPIHVFTRKQWAENAGMQQELQRALELPIVRMAFATLLHSNMPNVTPAINLTPGVSADAIALVANNLLYHRSGMTALYRRLHALTRKPTEKAKGPQWGASDLLAEDE